MIRYSCDVCEVDLQEFQVKYVKIEVKSSFKSQGFVRTGNHHLCGDCRIKFDVQVNEFFDTETVMAQGISNE